MGNERFERVGLGWLCLACLGLLCLLFWSQIQLVLLVWLKALRSLAFGLSMIECFFFLFDDSHDGCGIQLACDSTKV